MGQPVLERMSSGHLTNVPLWAQMWAATLDLRIGTLATPPDRCTVAREGDAFEEEVGQLLSGPTAPGWGALCPDANRAWQVAKLAATLGVSLGELFAPFDDRPDPEP